MSNESKTLLTQIQELQTAKAEQAEKIAAFEKSAAENVKVLETAQAELKAANEAKAEAEKSLAAVNTELTALKGELETAKAALANPAFADAALKGASAKDTKDGGVAGEETTPLTNAEARAAYSRLSDPKAQKEFRVKNWKALGISEER